VPIPVDGEPVAIASDGMAKNDHDDALHALRDAVSALAGAVGSDGMSADDHGFWVFTKDLHEQAEFAWIRYSDLRAGR
jgi:hypothetical protein